MIVGSRYGKSNQFATGLGKGFTVVCNDCGVTLDDNCFDATYCVFCEEVPVFKCPGCKQESHVHYHAVCDKEVSYVHEDAKSLEQLRDSKGAQ